MMLGTFPCAYWPFIYLPGEISIQILCHLKIGLSFLLLDCTSSLYIPDTGPLLNILFAKIFSHSMGFYFLNYAL